MTTDGQRKILTQQGPTPDDDMSENQNIEWKETWRDEHLKWVCGFANAQGGVLEIGKNDRGEVVGVKNILRLLEEIPNKAQALLGVVGGREPEVGRRRGISGNRG